MALPQDGQDANGLTKVTQIPAGKELMFIDPTTNEGGIITLEDLTKQILNGLASQAFALDAGQMTLPAALNKLNKDKLSGNGTYRIEYVRAQIPILNNGITTIDLKEYNSNIPNKQIAYCTVCGFGFNSVGVMSCNIISTSKIEVFNSGISLSDITLKFLLMYENL